MSINEIRDLMKIGAKYREPVTQPWSCIMSSIVDSVSNFVNKMCTKFKLSVNSFNASFNRVVEVLDNRFKFFLVVGACFHWVILNQC